VILCTAVDIFAIISIVASDILFSYVFIFYSFVIWLTVTYCVSTGNIIYFNTHAAKTKRKNWHDSIEQVHCQSGSQPTRLCQRNNAAYQVHCHGNT
jgi:hypothetical protein